MRRATSRYARKQHRYRRPMKRRECAGEREDINTRTTPWPDESSSHAKGRGPSKGSCLTPFPIKWETCPLLGASAGLAEVGTLLKNARHIRSSSKLRKEDKIDCPWPAVEWPFIKEALAASSPM